MPALHVCLVSLYVSPSSNKKKTAGKYAKKQKTKNRKKKETTLDVLVLLVVHSSQHCCSWIFSTKRYTAVKLDFEVLLYYHTYVDLFSGVDSCFVVLGISGHLQSGRSFPVCPPWRHRQLCWCGRGIITHCCLSVITLHNK